MKDLWIVIWTGGFLGGEQWRAFPTKKRAVQWARMAGVYRMARIEKTGKDVES